MEINPTVWLALAIPPVCFTFFHMYDYHVHTRLCNHAEGSMVAFIEHAIGLGFEQICFLDHLTITESPRPMTMAVAEVPLYFHAVQRLKRSYGDRIAVKVGLEVEFHPLHTGLFKQIVDDLAFDVIGSSIHQLDGTDIVSAPGNRRADPATWESLQHRYLETLEMMLAYDYFDIICHLDLPKKFGEKLSPLFEDRLFDILMRATSRDLAVEVNTSGFDHPAAEAYPASTILSTLKAAGIAVTIGSDAHRPEEIGRHFARTFGWMQAAGIRHLSLFSGRRRSEVPLSSIPISSR